MQKLMWYLFLYFYYLFGEQMYVRMNIYGVTQTGRMTIPGVMFTGL